MYCATLAAAGGRAGLSTSFCFNLRRAYSYIIRNNFHSVKVAVVNSPLTPLAPCTYRYRVRMVPDSYTRMLSIV